MGDKKFSKKLKWLSNVKRVFKHSSRAQGSYDKEYFVPSTQRASTSTITEHHPEGQAAAVESIPSNRLEGKPREEVAAIKIQTAFRAHQSVKSMRALRGLVRLRLLIGGNTVQRQSAHYLRAMQTLLRAQSEIANRRIKFFEEKLALQNELLLKHAIDTETFNIDEKWDHRVHSKEKIEANMVGKYKAAMRRDRALTYSAAQQKEWKNLHKSGNPMRICRTNPMWEWSWDSRGTSHPSKKSHLPDDQSSTSKSSSSGKKSAPSAKGGRVQSDIRRRGSSIRSIPLSS